MRKCYLFIAICFGIFISSNAQNVSGKVKDNSGKGIWKAFVLNTSSHIYTVTDINGDYSISAGEKDILEFAAPGYVRKQQLVSGNKSINIELVIGIEAGAALGGGGSYSLNNYWLGAKVGYNFLANNASDNFIIGSASINLNLFGNKNESWTFGVVGDIGNYKFNQDTTENKNIQQLSQSINGLSVGLGLTHSDKIEGSANKNGIIPTSYFREFFLIGGRLSSFANVGTSKSTVNLGQAIGTFGLEFEQTGFINEGSLDISTGISLLNFDKNLYNSVFGESKSHLFSYDFTTILPVSKNIGIFFDGTFIPKSTPLFLFGIILKQ